jgi:hypothetical protein
MGFVEWTWWHHAQWTHDQTQVSRHSMLGWCCLQWEIDKKLLDTYNNAQVSKSGFNLQLIAMQFFSQNDIIFWNCIQTLASYFIEQFYCSYVHQFRNTMSLGCYSLLIGYFYHKILSKYLESHMKHVLQWKLSNCDSFLCSPYHGNTLEPMGVPLGLSFCNCIPILVQGFKSLHIWSWLSLIHVAVGHVAGHQFLLNCCRIW